MDAPGFAGLQVNELSTNAVQAQEERGCTVTLVHGTFAPKATWTYPDSYVANELRKQLGPDVVITRFQWSGRNSHSARVNGGIELKKHLLQLKQDHPLFLHFVVGHSHGGNVAIYAANLGARFDGIVCLATPFLSIRNRKLGPWAVVAPIYTLCVGLQMKSIFPGQLLSILGLPFTTASLFLGLICELLVFALLGVAAAKVWDVATQSAWEWSRGSEWRPISKDLPVLVVRAKADEASGGLIFAQFSCWLLTSAYAFMGACADRWSAFIKRQRKTWYWLSAIAATCILITVLLTDTFQEFSVILLLPAVVVLAVAFALVAVWAAMTVVLAITILPILAGIALFSRAFGADLVMRSPLFDVSVETSPAGSSEMYLVGEAYGSSERPGKLMHSSIYENSHAVAKVSAWISHRRSLAPRNLAEYLWGR